MQQYNTETSFAKNTEQGTWAKVTRRATASVLPPHESVKVKKGKGAYSSLWIGNPSQSYGASLAIWDHIVLPATRQRWTCPALTPGMQASTRFTDPGGMEGWVWWLVIYWDGLPVCRRPDQELNPRPRNRKSNVRTVTLPSHPCKTCNNTNRFWRGQAYPNLTLTYRRLYEPSGPKHKLSESTLYWGNFIRSNFGAIHSWSMRCSLKSPKIHKTRYFGISRSLKFTGVGTLESLSAVHVMINSKSMSICNHSHARRVNSGKITIS